jgi:hypothetical protein
MSQELSVLSSDVGNYAEALETLTTTSAMTSVIYTWGSAEFGRTGILGGGELNTYISSQEIFAMDTVGIPLYARRDLTLFVNMSVSTPIGMWAAAQFGSSSILGAGDLNYYEG